jgi:CspA family cold shock protein
MGQGVYTPWVAALSWRLSRGRPFLLEQTVRLCFVREDERVTMMTAGTVKKVVSDRGFGFITAEDGKEYFFHRNELTTPLDFDRLAGGERVEFEVQASPKGPRAAQVRSA